MGMGRKRQAIKMNRRRAQAKKKARELAKKTSAKS